MKRLIAFCLVTALWILAGCGNQCKGHVSVIGGADKPERE